jgi:hypothetical protein
MDEGDSCVNNTARSSPKCVCAHLVVTVSTCERPFSHSRGCLTGKAGVGSLWRRRARRPAAVSGEKFQNLGLNSHAFQNLTL